MPRVAVVLALALVACSGSSDADHKMCTKVDPSCTPAVTPSYDAIYDAILQPKCARAGCHDAQASATNLFLFDRDLGYQLLLGQDGSAALVNPGDADCGELMVRLESQSFGYQMPPRDPLPAGEICAIYQWIEDGALR